MSAVLFYSGDSLPEEVTRAVTRSYFGHVAWAFSATEMIEALPGGVRISPIRKPTWAVRMPSVDVKLLQPFVGKPYDWWTDILAGMDITPKPESNPHELNCATLVSHIIRMIQPAFPYEDTPQHVLDALALHLPMCILYYEPA
ncbi:MAG: hypothetical protein ACYCPX_12725 [Acidiferrobacteraceae bacterium]